jgi:16S rRNA (cytidine1402-2'-O)-methyltransferase
MGHDHGIETSVNGVDGLTGTPHDNAHDAHDADPAFRALPGSLYVVATPLGNLRDLTLRALDVLASADVIAAEDTRVTAHLLRRYGIPTRAISLHAHNEARRVDTLLALLADGKSVALVSDAGTPAISDPGARLVRAVRDAGYPVVPLPGPSAVATAISAAGLDAEAFVFLGFLPQQAKARAKQLASVAGLPVAIVAYEAPHRVRATVTDLCAALGPQRALVVGRELTKTFETITRMSLGAADAWFAGDPNRERGEFVLIVDAPPPAPEEKDAALTEEAERWLVALLQELPPARAARVVASVTGARREAVYARALELKPQE